MTLTTILYRFLILFLNKNNYRFTFYHVKFLFNNFQIELFFIFRGKNALDFQRMALFHQGLVGILRHSFWLVEYVCIIQTISLADTSKCHSLVFLALEYRCPLNSDRKFANNFQLNWLVCIAQKRGTMQTAECATKSTNK